MKSFILSLLLVSGISIIGFSQGFEVNYNGSVSGEHELNFSLTDYQLTTVNHGGVAYANIQFDGTVVTKKQGFAELPYIHASVMLDPQKNVDLSIVPVTYVDVVLDYPLLPSKGVLYRCGDSPESIPYSIDPKSIVDQWYPENAAEMTEPYIIRDVRGTNIYVYPFQYNAAQHILRVFTEVRVELTENETIPINPLEGDHSNIVREMDGIYNSIFINYDNNRDDLTIGESGDILVITTARDEAAIQPYIDWKFEKGFNVSLEVVATGTNVNTLVDDAYNNNNNLLYVQLVGDWDDLQCDVTGAGAPMDPQIGCVAGNDDYADICVGRISSNSPADVTVQVDKFINYEKNPQVGAGWYTNATAVASDEGPGDDGEMDIQHNDVIINDKLDPFTYDAFNTIYDPGASVADVATAVNTGTGLINYTGHGYNQGWGTTGFSNGDVANLTNGEMLPIVVSVACNNGDFHTGTCFGEAWLRHDDGGAVINMSASISQPWDPPMRGQDYFMDLLIGGYDYDAYPDQNGINTTEGRSIFGAAVFNGLTLMTTESGGGSDWETAKTWNLFGDVTLQARTAPPEAISLSNDVVMAGIPFTTTVLTGTGVFEGALVALSQNDAMVSGYTDASGSVTLNHTLDPGDATLVVTGFNTETIYNTVSVVPPSGAYIVFESVTVNDVKGNANGLLDYTEQAYLTIALTNLGQDDATGVEAVISITDPYITILDGTETYGTIAAGATVSITDGFEIELAEDIPDNHQIIISLDISGIADETWSGNFALEGHAPHLNFAGYTVDDATGNGDGRLDPGETVDISVSVSNTGSSEAFNILGDLSTLSEYITINTGTGNYGNIVGGETYEQIYNISVSETTPAGNQVDFMFDINADFNITGNGSFAEFVGRIPVLLVDLDGNSDPPSDFETCLQNLGVAYEAYTGFPENVNLYSSIFVCLGVYDDNHVLSNEEGQKLADYLNSGGNLYMEGGDTWAYNDPTPVHQMFNIIGDGDGGDDLGVLAGMDGSIAEGMNFDYTGDNSYIDRILPGGSAVLMFQNQSPLYGAAVSNVGTNYRTVGSSFEFAGLEATDATQDDYLHTILEFFGMDIITGVGENPDNFGLMSRTYPNPFSSTTTFAFNLTEASTVSLNVFNLTGQHIATLADKQMDSGLHEIMWNGTGASSNRLPDGIYFYRLSVDGKQHTGKVVLMK